MLSISILLLICSSAVTLRRDKSILYARTAMLVLLISIIINLNNYYLNFIEKGIGLFHGLFYVTPNTHTFTIFILIVSGLILQLNSFHSRKIWKQEYATIYMLLFNKIVCYNNFILNKMSEQYRILEYSIIVLFVIIGGVLLISSCNLISIFLCIELQSYGLYILCSLYRDSEKAVSAGLTYFLLGGLSSCFILLSSALLYANSGNIGFDGLYIINNIATNNLEYNNYDISIYQSYYINLSLVVMSIGFLFKVTAAPFHFWSPDVYDSIPTIVTTFVAIFAKISIFILLLQLVNYTGYIFDIHQNDEIINKSWTFTFLISSLLSMIIGSILGLTQSRIKRLYAYSTINHVGFILLALTINSIDSIQSFLFYLMQYTLVNINAFIIIISIGYTLYMYVDNDSTGIITHKKESPIQLSNQLKGYYYINPVLAISLSLTLFSFVGIPPLIGFFAKQMVLSSALNNGYIFMSIIAIITSVISACYYLVLIKQIFFYNHDYTYNPQLKNMNIKGNILNKINKKKIRTNITNYNIMLNGMLSITISIITLIILLFILNPEEWLNIANIIALILFNC